MISGEKTHRSQRPVSQCKRPVLRLLLGLDIALDADLFNTLTWGCLPFLREKQDVA